MNTKATSPLTGIGVECQRIAIMGVTVFIDDPVVGSYAIDDFDVKYLKENEDIKNKITCVLAVKHLTSGQSDVHVVSNVKKPSFREDWTALTFDGIIHDYPRTPLEMMERSLLNLSHLIKHPSSPIYLKNHQSWLLYSSSSQASYYMTNLLCESGWLHHEGRQVESESEVFRFKASGWEKISSLQKNSSQPNKQAFVAMWFDQEMQTYFEGGFIPAIEHDGTKCERIDFKQHNNKICDEIITEIRRSRYVVADFTGNRGGGYYEAGFAHGLGIPVIWTVREDHLSGVHFDTRQYNHIVYNSPSDLRSKLTARIGATIPKLRV